MEPLHLVKLSGLMETTGGMPGLSIGLIDGPVATGHPDLAAARVRDISGQPLGGCTDPQSVACAHGTFIAGMLGGRRKSALLAICPDCTLVVRPIFLEAVVTHGGSPSASPDELAKAILECIEAGARVLNMSVGLTQLSSGSGRELERTLDHAATRGVIVVAAAGNQGAVGSSTITRHQWVIPVVACDLRGQIISESNLGASIGRRGLSAPGDNVTSASSTGGVTISGGTSIAAPFVTGAAALLWSAFPAASAAAIRSALLQSSVPRRPTVVPPLLDVAAAYDLLNTAYGRR